MNGGPEREYSFYERWSRWSTKPKLLIKRRAAEKIITTFSFQYEDFFMSSDSYIPYLLGIMVHID